MKTEPVKARSQTHVARLAHLRDVVSRSDDARHCGAHLRGFGFIELCVPSMTEHEYPCRNLLIALKSLRRLNVTGRDIKRHTPADHHGSILTSTMLPVPVPCSQKRIGSPARARPSLAEAATRKPVVLAGSRLTISSCVIRNRWG